MRDILPEHFFKAVYAEGVPQTVKMRPASFITMIRDSHPADEGVEINLDVIPRIMPIPSVAQKEKVFPVGYWVELSAVPGTILCQ